MKILFITDNFPPETNAPASRTYEHARCWVRDGADVTVVTGAPNFPHGRVYEGYRNRWRSVEYIDGIRVVRVKTFISRNEGFALRILDFLSFMVSSFFFGLFEKRPDVIVGTSPQFFTAVSAWLLSVAKWRPFVFELRDLWPASIVTVGAMKPSLAIRLLEKLELFLYRRARAVVAVTNAFRDDLMRRGIDGAKIFVVRNGVDLTRFRPRARCGEMERELGLAGKFVVSYLGTHGMAHALDNILHAASLMRDDGEITFLLVGDGACKKDLVAMAEREGLENVVFKDTIPKDRMPALWSVCDVALVHLKNDPVFETVIPSKIFEAFGMGKPVLIAQPDGEAVDIVRESGAGEWVEPEVPEALAAAVRRLERDQVQMRDYGQAAVEAAKGHSRDELAARMLDVLRKVASG